MRWKFFSPSAETLAPNRHLQMNEGNAAPMSLAIPSEMPSAIPSVMLYALPSAYGMRRQRGKLSVPFSLGRNRGRG